MVLCGASHAVGEDEQVGLITHRVGVVQQQVRQVGEVRVDTALGVLVHDAGSRLHRGGLTELALDLPARGAGAAGAHGGSSRGGVGLVVGVVRLGEVARDGVDLPVGETVVGQRVHDTARAGVDLQLLVVAHRLDDGVLAELVGDRRGVADTDRDAIGVLAGFGCELGHRRDDRRKVLLQALQAVGLRAELPVTGGQAVAGRTHGLVGPDRGAELALESGDGLLRGGGLSVEQRLDGVADERQVEHGLDGRAGGGVGVALSALDLGEPPARLPVVPLPLGQDVVDGEAPRGVGRRAGDLPVGRDLLVLRRRLVGHEVVPPDRLYTLAQSALHMSI